MKKPDRRNVKNEVYFFRRVAEKGGFNSLQDVKAMYYALIKVMMDELRENEKCVFPNWGTFSLYNRKERWGMNLALGRIAVTKAQKEMRFKCCESLRYYVHNMATKLDLIRKNYQLE